MERLQRKTIDLIVTALLARDEAAAVDILNQADGTADGFFAQRAHFIQEQLLGEAEVALKRAMRAYKAGEADKAKRQLYFSDALVEAVKRAWRGTKQRA
jgi:hypothetical protein